jgi:hypothetical protein
VLGALAGRRAGCRRNERETPADWSSSAGSETLASATEIAAAANGGGGDTGTYLGGAALVVALLALGLALRRPAPHA